MSNVYIPDARMTMPELFYPGRKPVGKVKIDWTHHLTSGLRGCYLIGNDARNLVDSAKSAGVTDVDFHNNVAKFGGAGGISFGNIHNHYADLSVVTSFVVADGYANFEALSARRGSAGYEFHFRIKTGEVISLLTSNGSFDAPSGSINVSTASDVAFTSQTSGTSILYHQLGSTVSNGRSRYGANVVFEIGSTHDRTDAIFTGDIAYQYVYDRILSENEIRALHKNPYQFLVPA